MKTLAILIALFKMGYSIIKILIIIDDSTIMQYLIIYLLLQSLNNYIIVKNLTIWVNLIVTKGLFDLRMLFFVMNLVFNIVVVID